MSPDSATQPDSSASLVMFAEHYQFYMYDESADPGEISVYWPEASRDQMLLVSQRLVGIGTVRNVEVPVQLDVFAEEPTNDDLDDYDHVVQCTILLDSGKGVIAGVTEDFCPPHRFDVKPGLYGVRVYSGGLEEVDEEGFEGEDFYRIAIWPAEENVPPEMIVKEWSGSNRTLH